MQDLSAQSDNELIAQSLCGDTAAFGTLVLRYRRMVIGTAYLGLLFVFAVYVGWVGALWRARARP